MGIYREVGARLGEANTLLGLGSLQDEPQEAMAYFLEAQEIFRTIGNRYSQGRSLLVFIVQAQAQLGDIEGVQRSLQEATTIGEEIGLELLGQVAQQIRDQLGLDPAAP
ncbi:MAG: hypothetical protein HC929_07995 [Leptolyngbyaceae cyanobacterium SM2_5_2]|nr:hypothetical protein [Leptolyngbyaceae cyanobacterium SM2_5_2]